MSGVQKWTDGSTYFGAFENDLKHGVGMYCWPNGEVCYTAHYSFNEVSTCTMHCYAKPDACYAVMSVFPVCPKCLSHLA